jgi:Tol biopolymer transport system component
MSHRSTSHVQARISLGLVALSVAGLALASPALAAKKGRIAFQAYAGDLPQVFTIKPDGTGRKQLTHVKGDPQKSPGAENPAWAPDGSTIAFDTGDDDSGVNLFTVAAEGGAITQIPLGLFMFNGDPAYSPDGSMISFDEDSGPGQPPVHGIFIANADGTGGRQLTTAPDVKDAYDTQSQWSPDGKWIAFTRVKRVHRAAVYVIRVDGTGLKRLTAPRFDAGNPDWSPDGSKILFNSHFDPRRRQSANVYWMRPDGSHKTKLTHNARGKGQSWGPAWSPDGKRIVFTKFTPIGKKDGRVDIYTMTPKGTALKRVTHMPQAFTNNPDWGPAPHS